MSPKELEMTRKTLLAAALAAGSLIGVAAHAVPAVVAPSGPVYYGPTVMVQPAPPAPLYEAVPAARAGYTWAPGFHEWRGDRYVWNPGHWLEIRQGWAWQPPRWEQRGNDTWVLVGGRWVETRNLARGPNGDRDGDGILNRYDNDRDGDGVRDQYDNFPNNPNRS
jgi:hypothetical protein